jgi:superfamily II DNA or RNA helicase
MGVLSRQRGYRTSSAVSAASSTASKSKSRVRVSPADFKWRHSTPIEEPAPLPVSLKALKKRLPWLKLLKPHQKRGAKQSISADGYALLFAQRTGKTWITGASLALGDDRSVLLVGPKTNLKSTWLKFFAEKLPHFKVTYNIAEYREQRKLLGAEAYIVLLMHYEAVVPVVAKLRRIKWDRGVWDEAQRLKNRNSRSSKDAGLISKSCKRRLALTGTPMDLSPKDLWAIMKFVEPRVFGVNWGDFEDHFLEKPTFNPDGKKLGLIAQQKEYMRVQIAKRKAPMRKDREEEFAQLISKHVMRVSKEDAGMVGAKIIIKPFDLEGKQLRKYQQLEKTMILKHKGQVITTPLKIVQMGKLQQITGGHIKDEDGTTHTIGRCKERHLQRLIDRYADDEPFVIFVKFTWEVHMLADLLKRMGYHHVAKLWGKVKDIKTDARRTNMLLDFQNGKYDVMVCQQKTGGVGVDLYYARTAFVYSMGHSFIDYDQMLSRLDFILQQDQARFIFLPARSTIDIDIITGVGHKKSITEIFYDRLKQQRKE